MSNHFTTVGMCARDLDRIEALGKDSFGELNLSELTNWYDWIIATRVYELEGDGSPILIEFQFACSHPNKETMRKMTEYLCKTYCLKNIKWIGYNPSDGTISNIEI